MEFEVRALRAGKVTTLVIEALNQDDARRQAAAQSCKPLSVRPCPRPLALAAGGRRSSFALILFSQELLTLLEAGLTIVEALDALLEKEGQPAARNILSRLQKGLQEGKSFSRALEDMPEIFPPLYVGMVRAAERTGGLAVALGRYVDYRVRLDALKSRVLTASIYPLILLVAGAAVSLFLLGYVVPRFAGVYQDSGRELPWLSALLIAWGNTVASHREAAFLGSAGAAAGLAVLLRRLWRQGDILRGLQRFFPPLADRIRIFQLSRLYLALGMLLDGGLPIVQGLGLVGELLPPDLRAKLASASLAIQRGESISQGLERGGLTTPVGVRMLRVGEQSGKMGEMMARIARLYDAELGRAIERFSRVFEPLLMAAIGTVIGGIVVLLYLPIFDLAGSIQ